MFTYIHTYIQYIHTVHTYIHTYIHSYIQTNKQTYFYIYFLCIDMRIKTKTIPHTYNSVVVHVSHITIRISTSSRSTTAALPLGSYAQSPNKIRPSGCCDSHTL